MFSRLGALLALFLCCVLASCSTVEQTRTKNTTRTFTTVVVDAGHGGKDNGAYRRFGPPEKASTLEVAQRLERKLRESQLRTVMTRNSDVFIPLEERVAIGNRQRNAIFVSIHFNDSRRRGIHGFETYYNSRVSFDLAQRIQRNLLTIPGSSNRGIKTANFRVLRKAAFPAVLVECGFLSNRSEGSEAASAGYRDKLADKIAEAIVESRYGGGVYHASAPPASAQPPTENPGQPGAAPAPVR
jgi:N-acetylmuramoyl-L-alanine amidase